MLLCLLTLLLAFGYVLRFALFGCFAFAGFELLVAVFCLVAIVCGCLVYSWFWICFACYVLVVCLLVGGLDWLQLFCLVLF